MNFATVEFILFYLVVFAAYWLFPRTSSRHVVRKILLLIASYYFYMSWDIGLASLIAFSTALDFTVGRVLARSDRVTPRRAALIASLVGNLGLLAYFKYAGFFVESAVVFANRLGYELSPEPLNIILPVGISFYTFQTLSYTIDLYRRRIDPCRSLLDFAVFVAFVPQLVAGPIVRAAHFLPQLRADKTWSTAAFSSGFQQAIRGLAKKVVIADHIALVADAVFHDPASFGCAGTWFGVIAFAVQIYCDFSGYSDIAIGVARMLGFDLPVNFDHPYIARSFSDFWRRWHISLSGWLRDYLYISLGGNRHGPRQTYRNLLLTMLLGGLWHGAAWTFVAWGFYHGAWLAIVRAMPRIIPEPPELSARPPLLPTLIRIVVMFIIVCLGWVLFRAASFGDALQIAQNLVGVNGWESTSTLRNSGWWLIAIVAGTHALAFMRERYGLDWQRSLLLRTAVTTACLLAIIAFWQDKPAAFIYFQF